MEFVSGSADSPTPPTIDSCRYRHPLATATDEGTATCELLRQLLMTLPVEACHVTRPVCEACCRSFPPSPAVLNPVVASLVCHSLQDGRYGDPSDETRGLLRRAEQFLDIDGGLPFVGQESNRYQGPAIDAVLRDILPQPRRRHGSAVQCWSVGVTTAPRRRATLDQCLDSLAKAGWSRPTLFVDGHVRLANRFQSLPISQRDEPLGAWPHYYLSLAELLMRDPLADAYMLVQDDAVFFDAENVREYLEEMLWPSSPPGIISLYWSSQESNPHFGWRQSTGPWRSGAVAFVFPRQVAIDFALDRAVLAHRWSADGQGLVNIPEVIEGWARTHSVSLFYPTPSLVQHIGVTSAIWLGSYRLTETRCAKYFAGDMVRSNAASTTTSAAQGQVAQNPLADPRAFRLDLAAAAFPEDQFPCGPAVADEYESRVLLGRARMRTISAVICVLCRDVMHCLPATAARIERLAEMFGDCQIVIFENDSRDSTLHWLQQWSAANPNVHVITERLNDRKFSQEISGERTARMAWYRNRCREAALERFANYDYAIVLDADLEGGWSYDGIAHTFGESDWDFVGSYGIWYEPDASARNFRRVHYDAFAFRPTGCEGLADFPSVNRLEFHRGESFVPLWSCFGGLGIYRMEGFQAARYEIGDCEHVTFHRSMRLHGHNRLYLNPSQVVVYTPFPERHREFA